MTPGPTRHFIRSQKIDDKNTQHIHELSNETKREVMIQKEEMEIEERSR